MPFQPHTRELAPLTVVSPVGGLNEAASLDTMKDVEATEALNCEFYKGTIAKRRGSVLVGDQISTDIITYWGYQYTRRDGSSVLLMLNGPGTAAAHLYQLVAGRWLGVISGTNPGTAADVFGGGRNLGTAIQYNDVIYYADGDVAYRYDGSTIRTWSFTGGTLGAAVLSAAVVGGALSAGAYTCVYTLYNSALGEETNPSTVSNSITAALNNRIPFSIAKPTGYTTNFDKVRIYRTSADGAGAWFYETEVAASDWPAGGATALTGHLTISDSSLGAEVTYDNDPAPRWRFLRLNNERAVGANIATSPSMVAYSKIGQPWAVPALNATYLKRDDGHPIRGLFETMHGDLFAGKRGGPMFALVPHPTLTYAPMQLPALHGLESHYSVIPIGNEALFADRAGIVRFNGQQTELVSMGVQDRFRALAQLVDTNPDGETALLERCVGIADQQPDRTQARFSFAHTWDRTVADTELVMDLQTAIGEVGAWHRETYKVRGLRFFWPVQGLDPKGSKLTAIYAGDGEGYCWRLRTDANGNEVFADNGGAFTLDWKSKWFGDGETDMIPRYLDFQVARSASGYAAGSLTITIWKDTDESGPVVTKTVALSDVGSASRTFRIDIPVGQSQYWKRLRVGFMHTAAGGDVSVIRFTVMAKQIGKRLLGIA